MLLNPDYNRSRKKKGRVSGKELSFGLCLSGGGFRATLFHLGVMRALHKVGLLGRIDAISAVSGGSILAAAYGLAVAQAEKNSTPFDFESFAQSIVRCASRGIRNRVLLSLVNPSFLYRWAFRRYTRTTLLADAYDAFLFRGAMIGDLPASPKVFLNCACLNNGEVWSFSRDGVHGINSQMVLRSEGHKTDVPLSFAVAASSAVPGLFPPIVRPRSFFYGADVEIGYADGSGHVVDPGFGSIPDPFQHLYFCDGGVLDNTGLETMNYRFNPNVVLISDGGGHFELLASPPTSLVLGYLPILGRLLFGGAGVLGRVLEMMMRQATVERTDRMEPDDPWRIHKYTISIDSPAINGVEHQVADDVRRIRTDLDAFSATEIRALLAHGESQVYHYLLLQRANSFEPVLGVTGTEIPSIDQTLNSWTISEKMHLKYSRSNSAAVRFVHRTVGTLLRWFGRPANKRLQGTRDKPARP